MDRDLGQVLGSILLRHGVTSVPAEEVATQIDKLGAWPVDVAGVVPIDTHLTALIRPELIMSYDLDWDSYAHGNEALSVSPGPDPRARYQELWFTDHSGQSMFLG